MGKNPKLPKFCFSFLATFLGFFLRLFDHFFGHFFDHFLSNFLDIFHNTSANTFWTICDRRPASPSRSPEQTYDEWAPPSRAFAGSCGSFFANVCAAPAHAVVLEAKCLFSFLQRCKKPNVYLASQRVCGGEEHKPFFKKHCQRCFFFSQNACSMLVFLEEEAACSMLKRRHRARVGVPPRPQLRLQH